jgi:phytoene desaturase
MEHKKSAIIIGSGVAGLATAIRLAVKGFQVQVFEQNSHPGGKLHAFTKEGYHFDAGPSLFTQPYLIEELFSLANEPIEQYFSYQPHPVACKYFFDDGTIVHSYTNREKLVQEFAEQLQEQPAQLHQYLNQSAKNYHFIGKIFLTLPIHKFSTLWKKSILKALTKIRGALVFGSLDKLNKKAFQNSKTVQIFNRFATYNGSNPFKAPGMLSVIPHLELNEGTYYPKGGMISITEALFQLAKKLGVIFHFNTPVSAIIHSAGKIQGVVAQKQNYYSPLVISNIDAAITYQKLLLQERFAAKILKQERSSSALLFYWGVRQSFPSLDLHNILFSNNYKAEFDHIFNNKTLYPDPTIYINITSKCEPGVHAKSGCENWFVMINVPSGNTDRWNTGLHNQYRQIVIDKINKQFNISLKELIETEVILDPSGIESKTNAYGGSLYGTASNSKMAAFKRHANFTKHYTGLYFVGGTVHPGGGIPLCLQSAAIATQLILNEAKKWSRH